MKKHESAQLSAVVIWFCCQATVRTPSEKKVADQDLTALSNPRAIPTRQV